MFALTGGQPSSFAHANPFEELDDEEEMDEEVINSFTQWAHKVNYVPNPKSSLQPPVRAEPVTIASLKDLDDMMGRDPRLTPLPQNTKKLRRAMRRTPSDIELI